MITLDDLEREQEALEVCRYIHRRALQADGRIVVDISNRPRLPVEVLRFLRYMRENRLGLAVPVTVLEPGARLDIWV